ncbi:metal ABC transporter ATP-binding protein [Microbacterium sp. CPCC 204701]|uniref:metal ABC transporter ATP-binding protein n=1 Tax=Microbacterium sp. CPCC 204701 TaxID=2493084 RepID=UPI001F0C5C7E|nr:metal ABC transporter ATP-binding protein [Microbacterium sp. CPCC 204701]
MIPRRFSDDGRAAEASAPALDVRDLTVRYGDVLAVDRTDLTLAAGTVCGLIGMNGSGKSTLLKAVMGIVRPERGAVSIDGMPPHAARRQGAVGFVPQSEAVDWGFPLRVRDVVMMGRYGFQGPTRRPRRVDREAVAEALERVELSELADRQIGELSGGQRKRAFVARCLAQNARLLLLDEPFAGVDKRTEATLTHVLRELARDGRTVLIATHDLAALPRLCDEAVLFLHTVLLHAAPDVVLRPENLVRAFGVDVFDAGADAEGEASR